MKVTLINHSDTLGGASVVTFRLMEALRAEGVDARMLVTHKSSDSPYVEQACPTWRSKIPFLAEHLEIFTNNGFSRKNLFKASIATTGLPLSKHPLVKSADAIILNWVNQGMLSLKEVGEIALSRPTLWTMHDMWNFTGICHHAGQCSKYLYSCYDCPLMNDKVSGKDLCFDTFSRKCKLYKSVPLTFVAVSSWLARKAKASALLSHCKVETIHNAIQLERFSALPVYSREDLGLPTDRKLIVFCAARIDDPIKCHDVAIDAMNELALTHGDKAFAVFVGDLRDREALAGLKLQHVHLGPVYDPDKIQSIMAHADIVLSTSSFESLPTILIEGQAAGAMAVGFVHDGRADIITDSISGYAIKPGNDKVAATAAALRLALDRPLSPVVIEADAMRFSYHDIALKYIRLIESLR